jgi:hypothetical protein
MITNSTYYISELRFWLIEGEYIPYAMTKVPYSGVWALCKGDKVAQQQEQATATFDQQLMSMMQAQYATQQSQLKYLQSKMQPMIDNPTGYTKSQLTSMRTGATDTNAQQFKNAEAVLNNQVSQQSGGSKLASVAGTMTQAKAGLDVAEAETQAGSQEQITQANANLEQQNYWNAINALNGVAAQENPLGYAGAANQGGDVVANLSQAVTAFNQSQLLGALGGVVGGIGAGVSGGFAKGGAFAGCFVAASFWGWNDIRTWMVRLWMQTQAPTWFKNFYLKHGEAISQTPMRWMYRPVFEGVLRMAN